MKTGSTRYLQLLERRLALLNALVKMSVECRQSLISMDLDGIELRTMEQEQLCLQIRSLDAEITRVQIRGAEHPGMDGHIQAALRRIATAQTELKRFNDANISLLRRSRYTFGVLQNLLNSYAPTYAMNTSATSGPTYEERI